MEREKQRDRQTETETGKERHRQTETATERQRQRDLKDNLHCNMSIMIDVRRFFRMVVLVFSDAASIERF